jgi:fructose-1,6-bisphosphatase/inositol monophosphatase family enzyme
MDPTINSLIIASRNVAKLLQRDWFELEMLQTSSRNVSAFCDRAYSRTKESLISELSKHSKFLFFTDEAYDIPKEAEVVLLINPIDSMSNFAKSISFFATSITYLKKLNQTLVPTHCIIHFPIMNEIYYCKQGAGAWLEKDFSNSLNRAARLRVSNVLGAGQAKLVASDHYETALAISKHIRCFGSSCYDMALFCSGKVDIFHSSFIDKTLKMGFELMIRECGGFIIDNRTNLIASNYSKLMNNNKSQLSIKR